MFLFPETDSKLTAENVQKFLSNDYQKLCSIAGTSIQSPIISDMPSAPPVGNSQENKFAKIAWAREVLEAISTSIRACSMDSQKILLNKLVKHELNYNIQNELGVSNSRYYALQKIACNEFADAFEARAEPLFNGTELEGKADLHVYA